MSTHNKPYLYKKEKSPEILQNTIMYATMGFYSKKLMKQVRNSRGKRANMCKSHWRSAVM